MASSRKHAAFSSEEIQEMTENDQGGMYVLEILISNVERTEATLNEKSSIERCQSILNLLMLALQSPRGTSDVIGLLSLVKDSKLLKEELVILLGTPHSLDNDMDNVCNIISNCVELLMQLSMRLPSAIVETFGLISIIKTKIQEILPLVGECLQSNLLNASENVSKLQDEIMKTLLTKNQTSGPETRFDKKAPPDDFHDMPILPRTNDIFLSSRVFLRVNKSRGGYANLQEYLDVQFRLYREDCISPLREGITEYVREQSAGRRVGRLQDGRLYKNVVASSPQETIDGLVVKITLDENHCKSIRWRTSQRLIYGSLVCLSPDHFQTMYFAVVAESERETLAKEGCFSVQMATRRMCPLLKHLTMVESTAFYESYRHVLFGLQNIKDGELPFEKYIVHCSKDVDPPKYVDCYSQIYDFWPIISDDLIYKQDHLYSRGRPRSFFELQRYDNQRKTKNIDILTPPDQWPTPEELHLDESQFKAFHSALTQEFVLIQGPPGTGKTYVGLQIAKTLLHNKKVWSTRIEMDEYEETMVKCPMLVVCYTNHALDQFVEGIIGFHDKANHEWRDGIVRVGGRCGSQEVEKFSLKNKRRYYRHRVDESTYARKFQNLRRSLVQIKWRIDQTKSTVLNEETLYDVIDETHFQSLCKGKEKDGKILSKWLGFSISNWIRRATIALQRKASASVGDKTIENKASDVTELNVDVETEAQRAEDERRIEEEDSIVLPEEENIGLNVKSFLEEDVMSVYQNGHIDESFKDSLNEEANEAIRALSSQDKMAEKDVLNIKKNLWKIPFQERWSLYRYWVQKYIQKSNGELETIQSHMKDTYREYTRELQETDARILKEATVIAMTTTGAARYHDVLNEVGPRIIIVEEAAEVLEAHIVTTLSRKCEHLILIGDHKQLEPKPTVFELAIKYNLGVSMFERMLNNGLSFHCLQRQHRMRPEISTLVRHIYPNLIDNENVFEYEHVEGVKKDLFFISHNVQEQYRDDIRSYSNEHEARYIMRLCKYLMLQGYSASQITVLAAYNGQMFCIRDRMPRSQFDGVRVSAIDNYQGEENDIILVSLVRSNTEGKVGFLGRDNRVCVTLSRAKKGMYVIGNFSILGKGSSLWKTILRDIRGMESIGVALPLYCQVHPNKEGIKAKSPEDFDAAPEGGCNTNCDFRLPCGHACRLKCHPIDREHNEYRCVAECRSVCQNGHVCKKKCHYGNDCCCKVQMQKTLSCKHAEIMDCCKDPKNVICRIKVQRILEKCGHKASMECCQNPENHNCQEIVTRTLQKCDHDAIMNCYVDVTKYKCKKNVSRILDLCDHTAEMECHENPSSFKCKQLVTNVRSCGHEYQQKCYRVIHRFLQAAYERRKPCEELVLQEWECGHSGHVKCYKKDTQECSSHCLKKCENDHECRKQCHYPLDCNCISMTEKTFPDCGHKQKMPCSRDPSRELCTTRVSKKFPNCEHSLTLKCGSDITDYKCRIMVSKIVPLCGHENEMFCHEDPREFSQCEKITSKLLACGHRKSMKCCHSIRGAICTEIVERKLPECDHTMEMECKDNEYEKICLKNTLKTLPSCGHNVEMICSNTNFGSIKCKEMVTRDLPFCKHAMQMRCYRNVGEVECSHQVNIVLPSCGHSVSIKCSENPFNGWSKRLPKVPICREKVTKTLPCKHEHKLECHMEISEIKCSVVCAVTLACGHKCAGHCKNCFQALHVPCKEACFKTRVCGHSCTGTVCGSCTPCQGICEMYCPHADCNHSCGKPCTQCTKRCTWSCPHYTCTKNCNEECDRPRCIKRCPKKLSCEHQCPGFCGEPCPRTCRECKPTEWSAMNSIGDVSDEDVFIVRLQECDHEFNSRYMDEYFDDVKKSTTLKLACCPTCSHNISWHPRYGKILREQRRAKQITLELIRKHTKQSSIILKPNFHDIVSYIKICNTFLLSQQLLIQNNSTEIYKQCQTTLTMTSEMFMVLDSVRRADVSCQVINDTYHRMYLIAAHWLLVIAMTESMERETTDMSEDEADELDAQIQKGEQAAHKNKPKSKHEQLIKKNAVSSVKQMLDVPADFNLDDLEKVQSLLSPHVTDVGQLAAATKYPVFEGAPGFHIDDWKICKKGHVEPSSSHWKKCIQCEFGRSPELETFLRNVPPYEISQNVASRNRSPEKHKNKKSRKDHKGVQQNTNDVPVEMVVPYRSLASGKTTQKIEFQFRGGVGRGQPWFKGQPFETFTGSAQPAHEMGNENRINWRHGHKEYRYEDTRNVNVGERGRNSRGGRGKGEGSRGRGEGGRGQGEAGRGRYESGRGRGEGGRGRGEGWRGRGGGGRGRGGRGRGPNVGGGGRRGRR